MASSARERSGVKSVSDDTLVITVEIDGDPVDLVVDPNAMSMMAMRRIKVELAKLGYEPGEVESLLGAIWIAWEKHEPGVTFDEVCERITVEQLQDPAIVDADEIDHTDPE